MTSASVKGLSSRETALLASWERERRSRVTVTDLERLVGTSARLVAKRMANKGALERIGRGVYAVRPFRALLHKTSASAPVLASYLLADEPYYLGGLWALTYHRFTAQQYASTLDAFVTKRRRPRVLSHARVSFHVLGSTAFEYGISSAEIEGTRIRISDPARTLLDLLDYPEMAGGLGPALRLVREGIPGVQPKILVAHALRGSRLSTAQRVGVLLERNGTPARILTPLVRRLATTSSRLSMIPGNARRGHLNSRWNVVENDIASAA